MLNRRILRGKVMQYLYAVKQSHTSSFHHAHEYIKEVYAPDLNSMEVQDPILLEGLRKTASKAFDANFISNQPQFTDEPEGVQQTVKEAINTYHRSLLRERNYFKNLMVNTIERLRELYLLVLLFPLELETYLHSDADEKLVHKIFPDTSDVDFGKRVLNILKENTHVNAMQIRQNLHWEQDILRKTIIDCIEKDKEFRQLLLSKNKTFEEEKEVLIKFYKVFVFKNDYVQQHLDQVESNWNENKSIVHNMVIRSVKGIQQGESFHLMELSGNWEEDKQFFIDLYNNTLDDDRYLEDLIAERTKNWDIERVAAVDKIILKMALSEMIHFHSIPVKVTINEYIELSKVYSTPKSKQFINGILDKMSADMINEGIIKKSGRGLIDNR